MMHIKCIHELYRLLDHIPLYLIVIWGHGQVIIYFGIFQRIPFILVLTSQSKNTYFVYFLVSRIFKEMNQMKRRSQHEEPRGGKERAPHVPTFWLNGGPHFPPTGPFPVSFASTDLYWPKTDYIYEYTTPRAISQWGGRETQNTWNGSEDCKNRKGDAAEAIPGCPFASINISFTTMRESISPLDYRVMEVTCIKLALVLHWLQ
jgi:hypothetical protein